MSSEEEDNRNIQNIAKTLNASQNNSHRNNAVNFVQRDVWNLSEFGFAFQVTKAVPSRYLRIRSLKKLLRITHNQIVYEQIKVYLLNDRKWDFQIADNIAFRLKDLTKQIEELEQRTQAKRKNIFELSNI